LCGVGIERLIKLSVLPPNRMGNRKLIEKALDLVIQGRSARDVKTKNKAFDGLWELLINLEYELQQKQTPSPN